MEWSTRRLAVVHHDIRYQLHFAGWAYERFSDNMKSKRLIRITSSVRLPESCKGCGRKPWDRESCSNCRGDFEQHEKYMPVMLCTNDLYGNYGLVWQVLYTSERTFKGHDYYSIAPVTESDVRHAIDDEEAKASKLSRWKELTGFDFKLVSHKEIMRAIYEKTPEELLGLMQEWKLLMENRAL